MARPVYILGAGFSKTIHDFMPVTAELNKLLSQDDSELQIELNNQTFENWLTINSTDLPFLEKFENTARKAQSEKIIKKVGDIIERQTEIASSYKIPFWLEQLINIWHAEKAVVISLNYDTLIERAINTCNIYEATEDLHFEKLYSENLTHPSPPSTNIQFYYDQSELADNNSFQLVKLHGSINWFYAHQDITKISSTKSRVREMFEGKRTVKQTEKFISEITESQDRLIIPPVTSKDSFYSSHISNILWKSARKSIKAATKIFIIGYSLPPEDFITGELIKEISSDAEILVADKFASEDSETGIIKNLKNIGIDNITQLFSGENYINDFITNIIPDCNFITSGKAVFISPTGISATPTALVFDLSTQNYLTLNFNPYNQFKDYGMPIFEQIENLYPEFKLHNNIYEKLQNSGGEFSLNKVSYKAIHLAEYDSFNHLSTIKITQPSLDGI